MYTYEIQELTQKFGSIQRGSQASACGKLWGAATASKSGRRQPRL